MEKSKARDLQVVVSVKVQSINGGYSDDKRLAEIEVNKILSTNSDTPKRKVINEVEDIIEDATRQLADSIHFSEKFTDGKLAKEERDNEE